MIVVIALMMFVAGMLTGVALILAAAAIYGMAEDGQ